MRLWILALVASALAQPAFARDHSGSHRFGHSTHSHHLVVHSSARHGASRYGLAWHSERAQPQFAGFEGSGIFGAREPGYVGYADRAASWHAESSHARTIERAAGHGALDAMIARHAQMNGLPESLVHRVVIRESRYNARVVGAGRAMGLMQIKYATARAMGYTGSPAGLLDPETNLTYAVRYLAGAYRAAGGNADRAVGNYARGYYASAKRAGFSPYRGASSVASFGGSNEYVSARPIERVAYSAGTVRTGGHRGYSH